MARIEIAAYRPSREGSPYFTCPSVWGVSPGKPILFRIPLLGQRPLKLTASGLPEGVELEEDTGILSGACAEGEYPIALHAENALGSADKALLLRVREDGARRTPLLGFTSWNAFGQYITQEKILETARLMDELGLADYGYQYVNIDSGWQGEYGGKLHAIQPNEKFPDMRALADAIHARGMKLGIYSTPMQKAWGGYEYPGCTRGQLDPAYVNVHFGVGKIHCEPQNAAQWAEWTIDYLKYDWRPCDTHNAELMKKALMEQDRDIPMCVTVAAGIGDAKWWSTYCCSWRDNRDSMSEWDNVRTRFDSDHWARWTNPGHYFDQDMLETGVTFWHENRLSEDEQIIAYTNRAMFPSPIQISCDLTKLTDFDLALLMNEEVIAVNQDALSVGAVCMLEKRTRDEQGNAACDLKVYWRPLENGDQAWAFFNLGTTEEHIEWPVGQENVRDLWAKKDIPAPGGKLSMTLLPHTVRLLRGKRK